MRVILNLTVILCIVNTFKSYCTYNYVVITKLLEWRTIHYFKFFTILFFPTRTTIFLSRLKHWSLSIFFYIRSQMVRISNLGSGFLPDLGCMQQRKYNFFSCTLWVILNLYNCEIRVFLCGILRTYVDTFTLICNFNLYCHVRILLSLKWLFILLMYSVHLNNLSRLIFTYNYI